MAKLPARAKVVLAILVAVGGATLVARSPRARASFHAAYVAFKDPSRVREAPSDRADEEPQRVAPMLEQPELAADLGRSEEADFADAGAAALASLTLPDLRIPIRPRTQHFLGYFTATEKGREAFAVRFRRAGRYRRFVEQALRDAELPEDLLWACAIGSGFEPQATSPKGAAGLFQLSPETAAHYGLVQSELVDERRSVPRSTGAGVTLLRDLFDAYGQWELALAALHLGREPLDEAIARLRERRGPRDAKKPVELEDLVAARLLPKETANFVPQVHAFAIVAANRGRFGLDDLDPAPPFDFGEIAVPAGTPLRVVARAAGVSIAVVRDYNPGLLRDRTPPDGTDTMVNVPADRVAAALAAFPALYAREMEKLADAGPEASPEPGASTWAPASAAASAGRPPPPAVDRFTLSSGVVVEQVAGPGTSGEIRVGARVEIAPRGIVAPQGSFEVPPVAGHASDLGAALQRVASAVRTLVDDGGDATLRARQRAGEDRRQRLSRAPYGGAWLAVGEHLFPRGNALAGTVLVTPAMPLTSVAIAEPPPRAEGSLRITVTLSGVAQRPTADLERAFAGVLDAPRSQLSVFDREDRIELTQTVPAPRVVFAWLAPSTSEAERAVLRLAMLAVAHNEVGTVARFLVAERHVAAHVRGFLDLGERASVAALEIVPAVPHTTADVETDLDAALAAFGERGPSQAELGAAKAQHRARVQADRARAGASGEPREAALARLARVSELVDAVTADELAALVRRVLVPRHRVVVVTRPRT